MRRIIDIKIVSKTVSGDNVNLLHRHKNLLFGVVSNNGPHIWTLFGTSYSGDHMMNLQEDPQQRGGEGTFKAVIGRGVRATFGRER
jgi:hypothetical protein